MKGAVRGASPHAHDPSGVSTIMLQVCLALVPVTAWAFYLFGWPAVFVWSLCIAGAIVSEALSLWLMQQPWTRLLDGSGLLTGWLLALTLPPWSPWWVAVGGSAFAIIIGKQIYGGIGQNIFNPALLARIALLISFPVPLTTWVAPQLYPDFMDSVRIIFTNMPLADLGFDGVTGATWLGDSKAAVKAGGDMQEYLANSFNTYDALFGFCRGSMGEVSALLALLGGAWLLVNRIITWHIPLSLLGTVAVLAVIGHQANAEYFAPLNFHLLSGGLILGAFFYATDYVTTPSSKQGQILFGIGSGILIYSIRSWGGFPEAVAFGILMMNALTPLIDRVTRPRVYGRNRQGDAIKHVSAQRRVN